MSQPIRRRIIEILATGEETAGTVEQIICLEFGVSRTAVQHHLAYFKQHGWLDVRPDGTERWYHFEDAALDVLEREVAHLRHLWDQRYGALERRGPPIPMPPGFRTNGLKSIPSRRGWRGHGLDPDSEWHPWHDTRGFG